MSVKNIKRRPQFRAPNLRKAIWNHVDNEDKKLICCRPRNVDAKNSDLRGTYYTFINESGFSFKLSS